MHSYMEWFNIISLICKNKSFKQQLCKSVSSLLSSLSGCWWLPGAVGGSGEQMPVIHEVSVALRDGIKIVWCIHGITSSFLWNVNLTVWMLWDEKHQFLLALRCIRFSRWEHFAYAQTSICSYSLRHRMHMNYSTAVSLETWGEQVQPVQAGIPTHHSCQSPEWGCSWRVSPASS